jgi:hypothetical protein
MADLLIANEIATTKSSRTTIPAAFIVCGKLRSPLSVLLGNAGFGALLSRALALANREVSWLSSLHVDASGSLAGLAEPESLVGPYNGFKGGVALLTQLLCLLVAFIGEDLTIRLVRDVWPTLPPDMDPGKGSKK